MIDIAQDIQQDLKSKLTRKNLEKAEVKVLEKMDEIKNQETLKGKSPAKGGKWINFYSERYARERKGRKSPVTLRKDGFAQTLGNTIEKTKIISARKRSSLRFQSIDAGEIHWINHTGNYTGTKKPRQIYPESDEQVPKELDTVAENEVFNILNE